MKIQGLAIIFILIILPITIVLGEYVYAQTETIKLEQLYDSNLINSTHDAIKAFQINTFNDASSDIADSKIESLEASVNAFYNSMEASFGMQGYSKETLQSFIPALVYTMYDGYYIYSPYTNIADISSGTGILNVDLNSNNIQHGFKPYVYYSCRYIKNDGGDNIDVIINYTLDNYITVQGTIDGNPVNGTGTYSGYLLTIASAKDDEGVYHDTLYDKYYYSGIEIQAETSLKEYLPEKDVNGNTLLDANGKPTTKEYKYIKLNGTKYYWNEAEEYIFYILGGNRIKQVTKTGDSATYDSYVKQITNNTSAINYYKEAYEFSKWVYGELGNLTTAYAVGDGIKAASGQAIKIFENNQIEYSSSNFNWHRKEVVRYSIESNLSVAIANFNKYTNAGTNFQMPKLKETEWEMLQNEVSVISFLQGLNIGGKVYNGYTVVTNGKTEEVVKEERIHITTSDGYYHRVNDKDLTAKSKDDLILGILELDFEMRKDGAGGAYYVHKSELGCYGSIVGQENVNNAYDSIYEYLQSLNSSDETVERIKNLYYTALGRERWGTYKVENSSNISTILAKMDNTIAPSIPTGITASEITSLDYGAYVTNYEASNASNANLGIGGWRIFHSDGTNIYLIADNYVRTNYIPAGKGGTTIINSATAQRGFSLAPYSNYGGWNDISSTMSWKWLKQCYSLPSGYNTWQYSNNQKATSYLLDTSVWSGFKDNKGYASYTVGAPTLELFAASYNKTHTNKTIDTTVTSTGYHAKWSTDASYSSITPYGNTISIGIFLSGMDTSDSLYVIKSEVNAVGMWLASPSSRDDNAMMTIGAAGTISSMGKEWLAEGARPIVCLNSSVQLEKLPNGNYQIVNRDGAF